MKIKNPFKKGNIMDTVVNVGIGGAANAAADYAMAQIDTLASLEDSTKNYIKVGIGVLGGSMVSNKYLRAAVDGIATVGVANIVSGLIGGSATPAAGLPQGTIGRVRPGNRYFRTAAKRRVAGVGTNTSFMGC